MTEGTDQEPKITVAPDPKASWPELADNAPIVDRDNLTLTKSAFPSEQLANLLKKRTDFLATDVEYTKKMLNHIFGFLWDFVILEYKKVDDYAEVHGRLIINHPATGQAIIAREAIGTFPRDVNKAADEALVNCAKNLGMEI